MLEVQSEAEAALFPANDVDLNAAGVVNFTTSHTSQLHQNREVQQGVGGGNGI